MGTTLKVRITRQEDQLKVVWSDQDADYRAYTIHRRQVSALADKIRSILEQLSEITRISGSDPSAVLRDLAKAGAVLRHKLFVDVASNKDAAANAHELLRSTLKAAQGANSATPELTVATDGTVHVPWSLVFEGDSLQLGEKSYQQEHWQDFWGSLFRVRVLHTDLEFVPKALPRPRANVKTLIIADAEELQQVSNRLTPKELEWVRRLANYDVGQAASWDTGQMLWQHMAESDGVLYVFGHSDGEVIQLSGNGSRDTLDVASFSSYFEKHNSSSYTVCLLNGCWSASGNEDNGFLTATMTNGFCGFIGAEAPVTNVFAARYGLEFMHLVLEAGQSVQDAFYTLRGRFWPQSLVYGCYAHPRFQIEPANNQATH